MALAGSVPIFVRRDDGPDPGVSIFAVAADGTEVVVRKVLDADVRAALDEVALPGGAGCRSTGRSRSRAGLP